MLNIKYLKNTVITFTIAGVLSINPIFVQAELGDQVLRKGMEHEDVKTLQQHLINLNYLDLEETTTYYGDQTVNAVMDFQNSIGMKADGIFGPDSFKVLKSLLELEPLTYNRILKEDISGEDVQALQERLKILGFLDIDNCTTYFGSETRQALMDFQNLYGIKADGIAGAETIQAINDALSGNKRRPRPSASRGGSRSGSLGEAIISTAKRYMGTPYSYGNSSSSAFDCSGFTQYIYKQHGIDIPRSSVDQATAGSELSKEELQLGDLVIFSNTYKSGPSHAGIYIGNGNFIHSSSAGGGVIISTLSSGYYSDHFTCGRRVY